MSAAGCRRVAIVTQCLALGGTQTYLLGVVQQLRRMNIEVMVAADVGQMQEQFEAAGAEVAVLPRLMDQSSLFYPMYFSRVPASYKRHLLNLFPTWQQAAAVEKAGALLVVKLLLKRLGVAKYADHSTRNFRGIGGLLCLSRELAQEFARFQPDMVLTSQLQPTIASLLARRRLNGNFPVNEFIMSVINCMDIPAPWSMHKPKLGDRLLSTIRETSEELSAIRPREAIVYVGNCIDDGVFVPFPPEKKAECRAKHGLGADDFVVAHMSSLSAQKWPMAQAACEAFIKFLESGRRGKFVLIGPGGDKEGDFEQFRQKASQISGQECMFFLGPAVNGEVMADFLNVADVFVGIARCIREAMLCEVPSIVYGLQGHPGIVDATTVDKAHFHNFAGRGCERASNPDDLAVEFGQLYDMPIEQRRELGTWSREFVVKNDTYSFFAGQLGLTDHI